MKVVINYAESQIHTTPSSMLKATGVHMGVLRGYNQEYFRDYVQRVQSVTLRSSDNQTHRTNQGGPYFVILIGGTASIVKELKRAQNLVFTPAAGATSIHARVDSMDGTTHAVAARTVQATEKHLENFSNFGKGVLSSIKTAVQDRNRGALKGVGDAYTHYTEDQDDIRYTNSRFTFLQLYSGPKNTPKDILVSMNGSLSAANLATTLENSPEVWG